MSNTFSDIVEMTKDAAIKRKAQESLQQIEKMNKNIKKRMLDLANSNDSDVEYDDDSEQEQEQKYQDNGEEVDINVKPAKKKQVYMGPKCRDCGKPYHRSQSIMCLKRKITKAEEEWDEYYACHDDEGRYPCVRMTKKSAIAWTTHWRRKYAKNMKIRKFSSLKDAVNYAYYGR